MIWIISTFWTESIGPAAALASLDYMESKRSWEILPVIGKRVKKIWLEASKKYNLPIKINGIDALPTFNFDCEESMGYKTAFTEKMLEEGFLATNLFYPTIFHGDKEILKYQDATNKVFNILSNIYSKKKSPSSICKGQYCKPSFKRLN